MCRIFYLLNSRFVKKRMMDFLQQSDHIAKYTPGIQSDSDAITHPDGFGFACFHSLTHRWRVIKTPKSYKDVNNLSTILDNISVSHAIIGHIRKRSGPYAYPSYENTHPFYYKNQLFIHNGCLPNFEMLSRTDKKKWVSKDLYSQIKGNTDSEWMFYVLLTVFDTFETTETLLLNEMIVLCIKKWLSILASLFPYFNANIIFANKTHTVITRYRHVGVMAPVSEQTKQAPSLYFNHQLGNGIFISSEPILDNFSIIPENTVIIYEHLNKINGKPTGNMDGVLIPISI